MKYCEFGLATKIVPRAALLWYFKNKVYSFFHWSRGFYLCFNTSLLIWNAEQIFMHKQCLYIPLFNCTESSKCTILVLIPRKSVHVSLVHWSIHMHWYRATGQPDKTQEVSPSVVTVMTFLLNFISLVSLFLIIPTCWVLFTVFFELS